MRRLIGTRLPLCELARASKGRYLWRSAPHFGGNIANDDPFFDLHATDVAHSGARSLRHGGGGDRELLHSFRGGRAYRPLAAPSDFAAWLCRLFRSRLRLLRSLQGEMAVYLATRPLQHRARRDGAGSDAVGARPRARGTECLRYVLFWQDHDRPLLAAADRISVGAAHRLSLLSLHSDTSAR